MSYILKISNKLRKLAEVTCDVTFANLEDSAKPITITIPYNKERVPRLVELAEKTAKEQGKDPSKFGKLLFIQLSFGKVLYDANYKEPEKEKYSFVKVFFSQPDKPNASVGIPVPWNADLKAVDYIPLALNKAKDAKVDMRKIGIVLRIVVYKNKEDKGTLLLDPTIHLK